METETSDIWKEFDRNVVSHSAAHHIVAIAELRERNGYARVSDVARALNITRGSASLTLKVLKQKGFVLEAENRFLKLSEKGSTIANTVIGKKHLIRRFLCEVLGVAEETAEVDTCKIEHLIGYRTALRLAQFLRFFESEDPRARAFAKAWATYDSSCEHDPNLCPACYHECLSDLFSEPNRPSDASKG